MAGAPGVAIFSGLKAGTDYEYSIIGKDGKVVASGAFKTAPDYKDRTPPPDFAFAVFGENYVNDKEFDPPFKTPGGEYEIYSAVASKKPAFCIWADGMNTLRNADESSVSAKFLRGVAARDSDEIKGLISKFPNYGVVARNSFYGKNNDSNSANIADASGAFDMLWANPAARQGELTPTLSNTPTLNSLSLTTAPIDPTSTTATIAHRISGTTSSCG